MRSQSRGHNTADLQLSRSADTAFGDRLVGHLPELKRLARRLCPTTDIAEDIAQTTAMRAWGARTSFRPGSDFKAWLFTILRNSVYSRARRERRVTPWSDTLLQRLPAGPDEQAGALDFTDTIRAMRLLSAKQRAAILAVGLAGRSCESAASMFGCAPGTVKSRVARARRHLRYLLDDPHAIAAVPRPSRDMALIELGDELRKSATYRVAPLHAPATEALHCVTRRAVTQ
jgi:RNA polymerase sigma-70 factor, ECF subfamily